ncbi:MAG: SusC/RagA family TonB-linked outer membrane protein [Bacteroidales bacterium]|nr:SusC/RagA family TonB-linked outer membrane protein [Bacteroidales bacterium]
MSASLAFAQVQSKVSGRVVDDNGEPLPGVAVMVEGTTTGTVTDFDGNYTLSVPEGAKLVYTFIGFDNQTVTAGPGANYNVTMSDNSKELEEVVVVGYGQQKKASVVGAITQTTGETLERAAGISDIGAALTGNLPGVITTTSSGMPGQEEVKIVIRGSSSPNNSDPLVLVDGIERPMSSVDMASVATLSVLKDASATAVYGVKGANGVILITTKRGQEGKAQVNVSFDATMKMVSKLPGKLDSYDALMARNLAIEHELNLMPTSWNYVEQQAFINMYRNQSGRDENGVLNSERYANVDWQDYLFKKRAMSYKANINVGGGTKFVRYFASADFVNEGDMFKDFDNGRGYEGGFGYNKITVRSNLDFTITPTTILKANLSGSTGIQKTTARGGIGAGDEWAMAQQWAGAYNIAPNLYLPQYSDGYWGYSKKENQTNSAMSVATGGVQRSTTTTINTDFTLEQDLKFLTEGLKLIGLVSWDNRFNSSGLGINEANKGPEAWNIKYYDPHTGSEESPHQPSSSSNYLPYYKEMDWTTNGGQVNNGATTRNLNYQARLFWGRQFGVHNATAMGSFGRQEYNTGTGIPSHREDWVFRVTYDYDSRYFVEYNGAYNGSEKWAEGNRFAFFNSGALGWMISGEKFMDNLRERKIIDLLKVRASYGEIGDDSANGLRFAYASEFAANQGTVHMGENKENSPYQIYRETKVGNPDAQWEVVRKFNLGVDYSFLDGLVAGCVEFFRDKRTDIYIAGSNRAVPQYFGMAAPGANLGEVSNKGFEVEVRLNKTFSNGIRAWANINFTHAENNVVNMDDAEMLPDYRKKAGYALNQNRGYISGKFLQTYDDVYGSPAAATKDQFKMPGDYYLVDFNADGVIDQNDQAPVGYSSIPQNTYNASIGADWKGWNVFVQFYGVSNVTRNVPLTSFQSQLDNVYDLGTWWSENHTGADYRTPFYAVQTYDGADGQQYTYDGSFLRLKNAEIGYTFSKVNVGKLTLKNLKLYVSGNNLWLWTKMPDDRESYISGTGAANNGAYPTVKRVNFGLKFSF